MLALTVFQYKINSNQMNVGTQQTLTATGHYSDNTTLDISTQVTWSSNNDSIASVSNANNSEGIVSALSAGSVNVTASLNEINDSTSLTISEDLNAPVSLSIYAAPNVILNDDSDTTTITVIPHPFSSSGSGSIADNTEINIKITEGEITLPNQTIYTSAGSASLSHKSTYNGIINIQATITGSSISQDGNIYATTNFANVIASSKIMSVTYDNNTIKAGSWFTMFVENLSSRNFTIDKYELLNDNGTTLIDSYDGIDVSGGQLDGGEEYPIFIVLLNDQPDNVISGILTLTDPGTGQQFTITAVFTTP